VHLEADVRGLPHQLHSVVAEKGGNLSLGQRQLLCIARALLRRSRILVMDEATASVDSHTDRCLQETLRTNFAHCTVICIAHRLDTIIDFDKIAVLDQGRVVEFDHPARLLMRETSVFKSLVAELGPEGAEKMKQIAIQALHRNTAQR
jgi:ABC-type multidrug transport system fused ATPase/permease subunit